MPEGVITEVVDGFATIDFVDASQRASALNRLLKIGGPATIEVITRDGPRRKYRVPEGNAREAGLLDDSAGVLVSGDQGASQALADAHDEARFAPSRPDAPTSTNATVGETTFTEARQSTGHVATTVDGVTGYPAGPKAAPHSEVIALVKAATQRADEPKQPDFPEGEPSEEWLRREIDAYAARHGLDTTTAGTKAEALDLIGRTVVRGGTPPS